MGFVGYMLRISRDAIISALASPEVLLMRPASVVLVARPKSGKRRGAKPSQRLTNERRSKMTQQETVAANRRNYGALPKATAVSIQYVGNKGKFTDGQYTACSFMVMVNVKGVWKPEGAWLHDAGMKTENRRGVYTTIQKAKEAKERILTRWGVAAEGKTRTKSAKQRSELAAKDAEIEALKAQIAEIKAMMAK